MSSESISLYFLFGSHIGFQLLPLATRNSISCLLWASSGEILSVFCIDTVVAPGNKQFHLSYQSVVSSEFEITDGLLDVYLSSYLVTGIY